MKFARTLSLFTALAFAPVAIAAPPEKEPLKSDEKPIVVPFELLKSRHMAIQVKINDKGPYRLIFDTGAPTNLVNNKIAKASGILSKEDKGGLPLFGASMGAKTIKKLEIGDLKLEGMPTMVMDHPTVAAIADVVGPVEGIIGFPFFARYKMTIDYEKKEMTLTPSGYVPGDAMQGLMDKLMGASKGTKPEPNVVAPAAVWGFDVSRDKDDEDAGVVVGKVLAKSPAAIGGLKEGDRLLTLDGRWTDTIADTFLAASLVKPGKAVTLVVKRDGKEKKLTVTPGKGL
ncbi:aspartyl protease family protein [Gemmata sp. G18]|uniref:Aspartyl protease family protein n=1 Tax=Gemmata palustris TaxID=2822762 RepID=A0ABS5BNA8_9BACT|nr:PDZ domain-containing protein [Gemmata palustris]MBP3955155.1 aspartyl protease family protein [Gemmata palustris]